MIDMLRMVIRYILRMRYLLADKRDLGIVDSIFGQDIKYARILFRRTAECRKTRRCVVEKIFYLRTSQLCGEICNEHNTYGNGSSIVSRTWLWVRVLSKFRFH